LGKKISFEDPCSKEEQVLFKKCPYICDGEHPENENNKEKKNFYCTLPIWHDPVPQKMLSSGYISKNGHQFECSHASAGGRYHIVFCLDDSGSMSGTPWSDLCVAVDKFISNRISKSSKDVVSIVIHNSTTRIACEQVKITDKPQSYLSFASGGNDFSEAFRKANEVISRTDFKNYIPLLLFLSDGGDSTGEKEIETISKQYHSNGLVFYSIAFGSADQKKTSGPCYNWRWEIRSFARWNIIAIYFC